MDIGWWHSQKPLDDSARWEYHLVITNTTLERSTMSGYVNYFDWAIFQFAMSNDQQLPVGKLT